MTDTAGHGRNVKVRWGGSTDQYLVAGVREKSVALNGDPVNVTSGEDAGWRKLLADVSTEDQVTLSVSGITKNGNLRADWFGGTRTKAAEFVYEDGSKIAGTFYLQSYTENGPYNDAVTFQAAFHSSGAIVYTPAA